MPRPRGLSAVPPPPPTPRGDSIARASGRATSARRPVGGWFRRPRCLAARAGPPAPAAARYGPVARGPAAAPAPPRRAAAPRAVVRRRRPPRRHGRLLVAAQHGEELRGRGWARAAPAPLWLQRHAGLARLHGGEQGTGRGPRGGVAGGAGRGLPRRPRSCGSSCEPGGEASFTPSPSSVSCAVRRGSAAAPPAATGGTRADREGVVVGPFLPRAPGAEATVPAPSERGGGCLSWCYRGLAGTPVGCRWSRLPW